MNKVIINNIEELADYDKTTESKIKIGEKEYVIEVKENIPFTEMMSMFRDFRDFLFDSDNNFCAWMYSFAQMITFITYFTNIDIDTMSVDDIWNLRGKITDYYKLINADCYYGIIQGMKDIYNFEITKAGNKNQFDNILSYLSDILKAIDVEKIKNIDFAKLYSETLKISSKSEKEIAKAILKE